MYMVNHVHSLKQITNGEINRSNGCFEMEEVSIYMRIWRIDIYGKSSNIKRIIK